MLYLLFPVIHLTFLYGHYPLHLLVLGTGTNVTSAFALLRLYFFFLFFYSMALATRNLSIVNLLLGLLQIRTKKVIDRGQEVVTNK